MWTDAVELGVTAFFARRDGEDDEVVDWLEAQGVEPWLAERLVAWIPVAFGRQMLRGAAFSEVYTDGEGVRRTLAEDPIYRAAVLRAQLMVRDEARAIALRSGEVKSIDDISRKADDEGRQPPRLETIRVGIALTRSLPPIEPGDGGVPEPRTAFAALLRGHGHEVAPAPASADARGPHTLGRVGELDVDAFVYMRNHGARYRPQVDFMIGHPRLAKGTLLESFAGVGDSYREAIGNAIQKLERGSLHVLIATLLDPSSCRRQVSWERWSDRWTACLGPQLLLYQEIDDPPLGVLVDRLRDAFVREVHDRSVHAIRVYTARRGAESYCDEVLLDGEPWPTGEALCRGYAWPRHDAVWASRLFLMISPA